MLDIVILLLVALIAGYFLGKYFGRMQGLEEGKAAEILILREKSLERGYCVLCGKSETCRQGVYSIGPDLSTYNKREEWS